MRHLLFLCLALVLAACGAAGPSRYAPKDDSAFGYEEMSLGSNTYRVVFSGNPSTDPDVVDRYALYRSAEIALAHGATAFIVLEDQPRSTISSVSGGSATTDATTCIVKQPAGSVFRSTVGASASSGYSSYSATYTRHMSIKTVRLLQPSETVRDALLYDAQEIKEGMKKALKRDKLIADREEAQANAPYIIYGIGLLAALILYTATMH